jgi:hypothetical protein
MTTKGNIMQNLKNDTLKDIEPIEKDSQDYKEIQAIKAENNQKYTFDEVKAQLRL